MIISCKLVRNILIVIPLLALVAPAADWQPVQPQNLKMEAPRLEEEADAEAIFWEIWVEDDMQGGRDPQTITTTYLRMKVFTENGAEEHGTVELSAWNDSSLMDIRGRTIKPDGTVIELEKSAIFEQMKVRTSGLKVRTKSFSLPDVEAGDIIEYQWRRVEGDRLSNYKRLYLQRDIPVWRVHYHVKSADLSRIGYYMRSQTFNIAGNPWVEEPLGYTGVEYTDLPAFRPEPHMPPEDEVRSWILVFYGRQFQDTAEEYWSKFGKELFKDYKDATKIDGEIKKAAASIIAGVEDPAEKIRLIREFCLNEITDVYHDRFGVSAEERRDRKPAKKPSDTLKKRRGNSVEISYLFASLLRAAGLDARIARVAGRDDSFFNPGLVDPYFLNRRNVAINVNGNWEFTDPAAPYMPYGMLQWAEEGVEALIPDPKRPVFVRTRLSDVEDTVITRTADLRLLEDGTLEGEVFVQATGHVGNLWKSQDDGKEEQERIDDLTEAVQETFSTAEVSDTCIENVTDREKPYTYKYTVRIPGYAMRTGKRLFVQPSYFRFGREPRFKDSKRQYDIYFRYAWTERDRVKIALPEGYELDSPESPHPINFDPAGHYKVQLVATPEHELVYEREFIFGKDGNLLIPANVYPTAKKVFDRCHEEDNRALTLIRTGEGD